MKAHLSPLKCLSYFVTELAFTANPGFDANKPSALDFKDLQVNSTAEILPPEKEPQKPFWRLLLRIHQNVGPEKNSPYNFAIVLMGHFEVHPDYPAEKVEQLVKINGSSILYSSARQILWEAMSNGPFRSLMLPTVSFVDSPAGIQEGKVVEPKTTSGKNE